MPQVVSLPVALVLALPLSSREFSLHPAWPPTPTLAFAGLLYAAPGVFSLNHHRKSWGMVSWALVEHLGARLPGAPPLARQPDEHSSGRCEVEV